MAGLNARAEGCSEESLPEALRQEPESKLRKEVEEVQEIGVEVVEGLEENVAKIRDEIEKVRQGYLSLIGEYAEMQMQLFDATIELAKLEKALPRSDREARRPQASPNAMTFHFDEKDIARAFGSRPVWPGSISV